MCSSIKCNGKMAVSHQWFLQWSAPSFVLSNITSHFERIDHAWNSDPPWSPPSFSENSDKNRFYDKYEYNRPKSRHNTRTDDDEYEFEYEEDISSKPEGGFRSGVTLWLAVMGLAHAQMLPADMDTPPFSTLYKWRQIDFEFPTMRHRKYAVASGQFIQSNVLPLGIEVWGSRIWLTLPSWRRGVPATLATVPRVGVVASPALRPYPDWSYHRAFNSEDNCTGLTSVFRLKADPCGRLWVLDSGQLDSQETPRQVCPPSLVVFDLRTDKLLARYTIPPKYVLQNSLFANLVIDTRTRDCSDLHVYISDTWRFGLLVFRELDQKFWSFYHHTFYPDPLASNFTLHGLNFQWTDGILGMSLSPIYKYNERILYFHPMSSYHEFFVSTLTLQDPKQVNQSATSFHLAGESRGKYGQSATSAIDRRGVMFYSLVSQDSIGCWDTRKAYKHVNNGIVAMNTETLIFPNDLKIDQEKKQSLWVLSNRLPMYQAGPLDPGDYNFRIMYADTVEAVRGTICDPEVFSRPSTELEWSTS